MVSNPFPLFLVPPGDPNRHQGSAQSGQQVDLGRGGSVAAVSGAAGPVDGVANSKDGSHLIVAGVGFCTASGMDGQQLCAGELCRKQSTDIDVSCILL